MKKVIIVIFILFFSTVAYADITTVGSDVASNYTTWSNGDNLGTGFGNWSLWVSNNAGWFLGSSSSQGFGDIDNGSKAFGLWGNPSGDNFSNAQRTFSNWQAGYIFEIDIAIAYRGTGAKGIEIFNSDWTNLFNFNASGDNYNAGGSTLGWSYSQTSIFHLKVTQNFGNLDILLTRDSDSYSTTINNETLHAYKLYCGGTDGGNDLNNMFFNNLIVKYDSTLPVELSTFTAQYLAGKPLLYWTTQTETDNMGWFVYRNQEEDFTSATKVSGMIEGHGTTTQAQSYVYEDVIAHPQVDDVYYYWLESIDYSGTIHHFDKVARITIPDINDPNPNVTPPQVYDLISSPNPFNETTNIKFMLTQTAIVDVAIYDVKGALVKSFDSQHVTAEVPVSLQWNGKDENGKSLSNGIYLYSVKVNGQDYATKQVILMK